MTPASPISQSPSISSFSSSADNSQSILKDVTIVSSGPAAEQIANNHGTPIVSSGPAAEQITNSSGTPIVSSGPSAAEQIANGNVAKANHSKVSNGSTSKDAKQSEPTLLQLSKSGSPKSTNYPVASPSGQIPNHDYVSSRGSVVNSGSSSSESVFKTPHPSPRPRRVAHTPVRSCSRSPLVPSSPGSHKGMPQASQDRPSRRS